MTFTPAQQAAISCDAPEILVSAAAGSGKTAVLTERILRHISNNIGIDRLLVVTFTEAAAAEMKERITDKIQALQEDAPSLHLANQEALLATADISTIHAFCRKLVKEHFQMLDIDPAFRVADESELGLIKSQVMDAVFEESYNLEDPEMRVGFLDLVDVYGGKAKDEGLDRLVRRLYAFLESDPFPLDAARRYAGRFTTSEGDTVALDTTPWAQLAKKELEAGLDGILEGLRLAIGICNLPGGPEKYIDKMEENEAMIRRLKHDTTTKPFSKMYDAFQQIDWGRLPAIREKDMVNAALKDRAQRVRDKEAKGRFKDLMAGVFFAPPGKMQADLAALAPRVWALMSLVARYAEAFALEKRNRNLLDFSDLEHFAIKVLYPSGPEDMTPGPVCEGLAAKYHEVLIDEYQDSNKVQDLILGNLASQRFMVGDVKQSIYRFRRANPGLFVEKYNRFTPTILPLSKMEKPHFPGKTGTLRIDLSKNFRSRGGVLHAANFFFSQLMCPDVGEVAYDNAAALHIGADYPALYEDTFPGMWVELLDQSGQDVPEIPDYPSSDFQDSAFIDDEPIPAIIAETRMIAACIHELVATPRMVWDKDEDKYRPCQLKDIVILARSANSLANDVIEELKQCGIDAIADVAAAFYQQQEIKIALAFLRITDNPRQDYDLIAVLKSPVYGFTPDELLMIKQCLPEDLVRESSTEGLHNDTGIDESSHEKLHDDATVGSNDNDIANEANESPKKRRPDYYDHLLAFVKAFPTPAQSTDSPQPTLHITLAKANHFLSHLQKWRNAAPYLPISRLIGMIYDDTNYPAHASAMPGGDIRQANLRLLLERAIEFEETSFKGLFHFINYIEGLYNTDSAARVSGAAAPSEDMANRVRLMSIHKSKGLEFPIVITGFLGKTFNLDDERQPIILHGTEGLGPKYVNLKKRTRSKTLAHYALSRLTRKENLSEELRCLYVALTRAKELLILTGRTVNLTKDMEKWADAASVPEAQPSVYYRQSAARYLDWIMPCLLRHRDAAALLDDDIEVHSHTQIRDHAAAFDIRVHRSLMEFDAPIIEKPLTDRQEVPALQRPIKTLRPLPSKLAISEIKRIYASDISPDSTPHQDPPPAFDPPIFMQLAGAGDHSATEVTTDATTNARSTTNATRTISAMRLGSVLHTIAEHIDFHKHTTRDTIKELLTQLIDKNLVTQEESEAINITKIEALAKSKIADRIRASNNVYRETPFVMAIPAADIYSDIPKVKDQNGQHEQHEQQNQHSRQSQPNQQDQATNESILVHGIIDCYFEESEGLVLVDFKSESPTPDEASWVNSHRTQLEIYKKAIETATAMPVKEVILYSFAKGIGITASI